MSVGCGCASHTSADCLIVLRVPIIDVEGGWSEMAEKGTILEKILKLIAYSLLKFIELFVLKAGIFLTKALCAIFPIPFFRTLCKYYIAFWEWVLKQVQKGLLKLSGTPEEI
ncbi:hypothetical protein C5S31_04065 [ANME-1 cluster archaeon GoMg2]|nr:hypothetical protein [ANME-1 cluster archaeon GoMg2]